LVNQNRKFPFNNYSSAKKIVDYYLCLFFAKLLQVICLLIAELGGFHVYLMWVSRVFDVY